MEDKPSDLQGAFYAMLTSSFKRISKYDELMSSIENLIFTEDTINDLRNDPQQLLNLHNTLDKKKQSNEYFALKVLDIANKNAILMKLINNIIDDTRSGRKLSGNVDPDVQAVVNLVRQQSLNKLHGDVIDNE